MTQVGTKKPLTREQAETVWDDSETRVYFFIPGLFKFVGIVAHCLISAAIVFIDTSIASSVEWIKLHIESFLKDSEKPAKPATPSDEALAGWLAYYTRWFYNPISDCWNRPIKGAAGKKIEIMPRKWEDDHGVRVLKAVEAAPTRTAYNLGSYNYLGFGGPNEITTPDMINVIEKVGVTVPTTAAELGISREQRELEETVARFLGKEDAVVIPMGFATNSLILPALAGPGSLIVSDALNHASIITGLRLAGATIRKVEHSNMADLARALREAATRRPAWKRVLVVVEGLYSMEGEICPLPTVVRLCKHYGALLYVDEAHSIGALGPHGRGVCDYFGVDTAQVDVLMGTFTKSFGSIGGYVASDRATIAHLRHNAQASLYGIAMAPGCAQQVTSALRELDTPRGAARIAQLHTNTVLLRRRLNEAGCLLLGPSDSPVIPILVKHAAKLTMFSRECLRRGVAVVVVGYPATPLLGLRARFCVSAAFETHEIEEVAATVIDVARLVGIDFYASKPLTQSPAFDPSEHENLISSTEPPVEYHSAPFAENSQALELPDVRVLDPQKMPRVVLSAPDYMGLVNSPSAVEAAVTTAREYGCGACGPRGFYGSTDKHLEIEQRLQEWLGTEAAILYSYGVVASHSVLPAYTNRPDDIVLYDEAISLPVRYGVQLCHARKLPFPHNNPRALAAILRALEGRKKPASRWTSWMPSFTAKPRKFIVTEGVFPSSGDVAPLPELVALKRKYGFMLLVDETHSVGSLGRTGRGLREYWAERTGDASLLAADSVDLLVGSLETSLGSIGGFCCGRRILIQHQVLSGLGYCFSASTPPYLLSAAVASVDAMESRGESLAAALRASVEQIHVQCRVRLSDIYDVLGDGSGFDAHAPLIYVALKRGVLASAEDEARLLADVESRCWAHGRLAVALARFMSGDEGATARPALKLCASVRFSSQDYEEAFDTIGSITRKLINSWGKRALSL